MSRQIIRGGSYLSQLRSFYINVNHKSENINIYHCCVQKTGSQWIKAMLWDLMTYQYCGLKPHSFQGRRLKSDGRRSVTEPIEIDPFPENTIVSSLYMTYENYLRISKEKPHKTFFVMRDPRDLVVSWYFSTKNSHIIKKDPSRGLYQAREKLNHLSERDGLLYTIDSLHERGKFALLSTWAEGARKDNDVLMVRFEDLTARDNFLTFRNLFNYLDIQMPDVALRDLIHAYSFERLTGRKRGVENRNSHLRSGTSGDWKHYFDDVVEKRFRDVTGNLLEQLDYI